MPRLPELWHHQRLFVTDGNPPGVTGHAVDRSTQEFDGMYAGTPPWEIGRPQQVFVDAADAGKIRGRVLDAGCGTGEHVLMVAARGLDATGTDSSPRAIGMAKEKMAERNLTARFLVGDALELGRLGEQFDTVLDSGLFHVFDDDRRARYVESLTNVVRPGGTYLMCCFSDREPGDWGPRRITEDEIRGSFGPGWRIESIEAKEFDVVLDIPRVQAWFSTITRT